jgi:hypothetical protein
MEGAVAVPLSVYVLRSYLRTGRKEEKGGTYVELLEIPHQVSGSIAHSDPCTLLVDGYEALSDAFAWMPVQKAVTGVRSEQIQDIGNNMLLDICKSECER